MLTPSSSPYSRKKFVMRSAKFTPLLPLFSVFPCLQRSGWWIFSFFILRKTVARNGDPPKEFGMGRAAIPGRRRAFRWIATSLARSDAGRDAGVHFRNKDGR